MDAGSPDEKLRGFVQHLLKEAQGDPLRALGLLVLVLREDKLVQEPLRHLAGMPTGEGMQHCILRGELFFQKAQLDGGRSRPDMVVRLVMC